MKDACATSESSRAIPSSIDAKEAGHAIKVPFWKWLLLREYIQQRKRWRRVADGVDGFEKVLEVDPW